MKNKRFTAKILIDIGMTICLLLLMPYSLISETAHEWIGMAMLVLFISHHILNHKWVTSVRKGKYNAFRVIQTVLVIIMLILIMGSMISGILLSNHIFKWIKISGTYMTARQIHMFCAYWGLVVMSLHLGFHWNIAVAMVGRLWEHPSVIRTWAARSVATTIAGYMVLLGRCDELWVFGGEASAGMCAEIAKAKRHGKKIRYFDSLCNETNRALEIGPERLQEER